MKETLGLPSNRINYQPMKMVAERVGLRLGCAPSTAGQYMKPAARDSIWHRVEVVIEELVRHGHCMEAQRQVDRLTAIFTRQPRPMLCTAILLDEADADADLAKVRSRYQLDQSHDNAIALGRAMERHEALERIVALALRELESD